MLELSLELDEVEVTTGLVEDFVDEEAELATSELLVLALFTGVRLVILTTVVWEGVTAGRVVLVLGLVVTTVDVPERDADSLIVVRIVNFVLLVVVDGFTVLLVDGEIGILDAVEDLELTELVEAGDPLREDEEEGRWYW